MTEPSEFLSPTIRDARRLFGPNLFSVSAGAVLDVDPSVPSSTDAITRWPGAVQTLAAALGWPDIATTARHSRREVSLFLTAPLDGLRTASDLSEHAWVMAETGRPSPAPSVIETLQAAYAIESARTMQATVFAARARRDALNFSLDDESCAIGGGAGVIEHAFAEPRAKVAEFDRTPFDIPVALVTGSNGKTTTARLVAAMWRTAGKRAGWSCSDGVYIDGAHVETGDYTGPGGARRVLSDARVEAAVLETARGGMLRRGLALTKANGAIITNISDDHLGEYGVESLRDLAQAKRVVARALSESAPLVLNADDATLRELAEDVQRDGVPVAWFSVDDALPTHAPPALPACVVRQEQLLLRVAGAWVELGDVRQMPVTLSGVARHNVANAAGAALLAYAVGVPIEAIRATLSHFGNEASDNPGRLMVRRFGALTVLMDYAHNPDGISALCRTAATMPARRRLLLMGQAGNREEAQLRALAAAAWRTQSFDLVLLKELPSMLRGRAVGEIPAILRAALVEAGAPPERVIDVPSEFDGVLHALRWSRDGDVLVLGVHVDRARVLSFMNALGASGWVPGAPIPV